MTRLCPATPHAYADAFQTLRSGGLVALPTETVYGLAAHAADPLAVQRIYAVKTREAGKPLALCVDSLETARKYGEFSSLACELADTFWPGPLSLIVPAKPNTPLVAVIYGQDEHGPTLSLRCPKIDWAPHCKDLPIVLTSANLSGGPNPKTAQDVLNVLAGNIDMVIDNPDRPPEHMTKRQAARSGQSPRSGQASTLLSVNQRRAKILRPGALEVKAFAAFDIEWV